MSSISIMPISNDKPIQIPQLWRACLPNTDNQQVLIDCITLISHQEAEKTVQSAKKVADSQALKAAKAQGKDVYEAEKAQIAWEKVIAAELKMISAESLWEWNNHRIGTLNHSGVHCE